MPRPSAPRKRSDCRPSIEARRRSSRPHEQRETLDRAQPLSLLQARDERFDARGIEDGTGAANADAGARQPDVDAAAILRVAEPHDVSFALQPIDRERHRRRGDPHVPREIHDRRRVELVEMIKDARLVAAQQALGLRVADVARVAGEIDARIQCHDGGDGAGDTIIHLFCQNNIYFRKLLQTRRLRLPSNCPTSAAAEACAR